MSKKVLTSLNDVFEKIGDKIIQFAHLFALRGIAVKSLIALSNPFLHVFRSISAIARLLISMSLALTPKLSP